MASQALRIKQVERMDEATGKRNVQEILGMITSGTARDRRCTFYCHHASMTLQRKRRRINGEPTIVVRIVQATGNWKSLKQTLSLRMHVLVLKEPDGEVPAHTQKWQRQVLDALSQASHAEILVS